MNALGRPLSSPPDAPDHGDAIASAVERLSASPSFVSECAHEQPGVPTGACAAAAVDYSLRRIARWVSVETTLEDLCAHYERLDSLRGRVAA